MTTLRFVHFVFLSLAALIPHECYSSDPSDFLVTGLEEFEPAFKHFNGTMYAGLLPIDVEYDGEPRGKLSFWLFNPDEFKDTLTIWLNGGPGCSSYHAGLFLECSPVTYPSHPAGHGRTSVNEILGPNNYSWTRVTNLLFVEQPVGTGFSYGSRVDSEADLSADFYNFLVNFFETFETMSDKSLYIVGESYAGMYVPSIAQYIHNQNKKTKVTIRLSGIGLGNGWIDPMGQGSSTIEYAYWHGMIDSASREILWKAWERCKKKMHMTAPFHDFTTPDECAIEESVLALAGAHVFPATDHYGPNQYDVTTWDNYPLLYSPSTPVTRLLDNPEVRKILHFESGNAEWVPCIPGAGRRRRLQEASNLLPGQILLANDRPESVLPYIAELLDDAGIRVLVYAGDRDLSVNLQGSEQVLNDMTWSGKRDWKVSNRYLWMVGDDVAGYVKTHKNLDMLMVQNSGHLVPYNVPVKGIDLIKRLTGDLPFGDILLPTIELKGEDQKAGWEAQVSESSSTILVALVCFAIGVFLGFRCYLLSSRQYEPIFDLT